MRFKSGLYSGLQRLRRPGMDLDASQVADDARGVYLCEICEEVMTNDVLSAAESPTGTEAAVCVLCVAHLRRR